jgi:hypothetical protein
MAIEIIDSQMEHRLLATLWLRVDAAFRAEVARRVPDLARLRQLRAMRRTLSDRLACGSGQPVPA